MVQRLQIRFRTPIRDRASGDVDGNGETSVFDICGKAAMTGTEQDRIDELVRYLMTNRGLDVSRYRPSCIRRRIGHRLAMLGIASIDDYMDCLQRHPGEIDRLLDVLTIHVTGFFRDEDVFAKLSDSILPDAIARRQDAGDRAIRIWSAGCSTGEETWSLAIAIDRVLRGRADSILVEVFGTDISDEACRVARKGFYDDDRVAGVPSMILDRYFSRRDGGWRINDQLRGTVRFRAHDLFSPPPFSMLDIIVCRNVLIHFEHSSRSDVLRYFHGALRGDGVLVLGKSEAVAGPALDRFDLVDPRAKTYRKRSLCASCKED